MPTLVDPLDLVLGERYAHGDPHAVWAHLRATSPVHWCEPEGYRPFWAVTRHADVKAISTDPTTFSSAARQQLMPIVLEQQLVEMVPSAPTHGGVPLRMLVNMDPPDHRTYRALAGPYFRPRVLRLLEERVGQISAALLDRHAGVDVELDVATDIAAWHPLRMLCEILGVAAADEATLLRLTDELFGAEDPELAPEVAGAQVFELIGFMNQLLAEKRQRPGDDLASVLAQATIDGEPVPHADLVSYLILVATAGHDTTRNALSGGIHALAEHPDQLALLRERPDLAASAADEMVRWASPVIHFIRTATVDTEVGGVPIRAGDALVLFYPSANRDEAVFDDPFAFRVDRHPNPHLGFGVGEHYCLGAGLARMELRVMLEHLLPRLDRLELAGPPARTGTTFVGGFKHLPVRWTLR